ncbi:MAG TPA: putative metal-binding motif-containing protein [Myxococcota bacterium]|nr:putative metal-binding motif-containing protein [Myxococcota bacterium]
MSWLLSCSPMDEAYLVASGSLAVDTEALDFDAVAMDEVLTREFTIANGGHDLLSVDLTPLGRGFTASQDRVELLGAQSATLSVWFSPYGRDAALGELVVETADEVHRVTLSGTTNPDGDDDGYEHEELDGTDCDDTDAAIHPGADEVWYDEVDQDCAGGDDFDQDADGYARRPEGLDCDDERGDVNPSAEEVWYDGIDQDCRDDDDYDQDADGYPVDEDCDDTKAWIGPCE